MIGSQMHVTVPDMKKLVVGRDWTGVAMFVAKIMRLNAAMRDGILFFPGSVSQIMEGVWPQSSTPEHKRVIAILFKYGFELVTIGPNKGWSIPENEPVWKIAEPAQSSQGALHTGAESKSGEVRRGFVCMKHDPRLVFATKHELNVHYNAAHRSKKGPKGAPMKEGAQVGGDRYISPGQKRLLKLIRETPGMHPRDYRAEMDRLGLTGQRGSTSPGAVSSMGVFLLRRGFIRSTGARQSTRWYPRTYRPAPKPTAPIYPGAAVLPAVESAPVSTIEPAPREATPGLEVTLTGPGMSMHRTIDAETAIKLMAILMDGR